jgi:hypothetical protein
MRRLLERRLVAPGVRLHPDDQDLLLDLARGRPGWLAMFVERLADERYWRADRARPGRLYADVSTAILERHIRANNERFDEID